MDFADRMRDLAARSRSQLQHLATEEATKTSLVLPFLSALGYDIFDPTEVTPELHADIGVKKGEKVDYAILKDGKPIILIECKACGCDLEKAHASQLYRYFSATEARFGVLTNGTTYRFFSDLEKPNAMDSKHFFEFDLLAAEEPEIEELKKFTKSAFDLDSILATASQLKYVREIKRYLAGQLNDPAEDFVRLMASQVYSGRFTQAIKEQFQGIVRRAFQTFISDRISDRLKFALSEEAAEASAQLKSRDEAAPESPQEEEIETTEEELQGYYIVKAILSPVIDVRRIALRDVRSYCGVLLDDNNRKPICRLWFNSAQKYVGFFDEEKREQRVAIDDVNDLYAYAERLVTTIRYYERN